MATVNVILPGGLTYTTATVPAETTQAATHEHDEKDNHEAIHVDDNQVVIDAHKDEVIKITKDLAANEKYILLQKANGQEVFSVENNGDANMRDITANEMFAAEMDADHISGERLTIDNTIDIYYDEAGESSNNDNSRVLITKPVYIQPTADNNIPPTLNTSGSIALQGSGKVGFVPHHPNGAIIEGAEYSLGRSEYIGDLSHDNDGLLLRTRREIDGVTRNHKLLLCPDPTDPNLTIYSTKHQSDYLQFINVGPEVQTLDDNIVFAVGSDGDIRSQQMNDLDGLLLDHEQDLQTVNARLDVLEESVGQDSQQVTLEQINDSIAHLNNEVSVLISRLNRVVELNNLQEE